MACPWHAWRQPSVPLTRVLACGVYVVPQDMLPPTLWAEKCARLLQTCKEFHEQEFPGSTLEWVLHGPFTLPFKSSTHRNRPDAFYTALDREVKRAAKEGCLPSMVASSSAMASSVQSSRPFLPTIVDFVCFADWGLEPTNPAMLSKYYIGKAAGTSDISDITLAGGSRSSFQGRRHGALDRCKTMKPVFFSHCGAS